MKARRGDDPRLAALPWGEQCMLEVTTSAFDGVAVLLRAIKPITGRSRSANIGQILIVGAHGPRRLYLLVVGEPS
jgi:L-lactate dehydrogenase complex protein LldG